MAFLPIITFTILLVLFTKQTLTEQPKPEKKASKEELLARLVTELVLDSDNTEKTA
jgi:hypothetical protein